MENILLIAMVVIAVLIIIVVMLQKSSSMGLGAYSGSNDSLFGSKGPASFLAKTTFILGAAFVVVVIWLGVVYNNSKSSSKMDVVVDKNAAPVIEKSITKDVNAAPGIKKDANTAPKLPDAK